MVIPTREVIKCLSGLSSWYVVFCLGRLFDNPMQQMSSRNIFKFDWCIRYSTMLALSRRIFFHFFRPNVIPWLLAMSRWYLLDHCCSIICCNVRCLSCWYLLCLSKHFMHSMSPEFFFIRKRCPLQSLPRQNCLFGRFFLLLNLSFRSCIQRGQQ